jgi:hypothetical protein
VITEDLHEIRSYMSGMFSSFSLALGYEAVHDMLHQSLAAALAVAPVGLE